MFAATRVEFGSTLRTGAFAAHVFIDGELVTAHSAQHCLFIKLVTRPDFSLVKSSFFVARMARIVPAAAYEFDGDDVQGGMPVFTPGLIVNGFSVYPDVTYAEGIGRRVLSCTVSDRQQNQ